MKAVYCPYCGGRTKRNGRTSSGSQRWRCTACGASTTVRYDDTATRLDEFLGWLLSKDSQLAMPGGGRSFRRRTAEFWEVWPMPVPDGELHRVLFVDGIWLAERLVVLICCSGERVVSWYMANPRTRGRGRRSWSRYRRPTSWSPTAGAGSPRPCARPGPGPRSRDACSTRSRQVKVHDDEAEAPGGAGAVPDRARPHAHRDAAPGGAVARALPRLVRLLGRLPRGHHARRREEGLHPREAQAGEEVAVVAGLGGDAVHLPRPRLTKAGPLPSTNNRIEGGVNAQLRAVLRNHRGLTSLKRVKAVFWWCHAHSGDARTAREKLATMPTGRGHRPALRASTRHPVARRREAGMGRQGRVGRAPPQGPVPVLAGLMDGNGCSIETHILSYKPKTTTSKVTPEYPMKRPTPSSRRSVPSVGAKSSSDAASPPASWASLS